MQLDLTLSLALIIGTPFVVALLALLLGRDGHPAGGWAALIAPAVVTLLGIGLWRQVGAGGLIVVPLEWFPSLGISANLRVDRLGAFFVLLIGIIGLGIVQYSRYYLGEKATGGFWGLLLSFMGSMLGIVLSDSLILLFVFWEMTTITSALLIGMGFEEEEARHGAIQAFLVTGAGGLALLGGIVLLGQMAGSYDLSTLAERSDAILADPRYVAPMLLMLLGAFTKSAQFPFHFWLPGAMAAPAPISSYLHSATMVKAGVFLLGRMFPIFSEAPLWLPLLTSVGLVTFLVAGWNAIRAYDVKQLLAHSTVAYLGVLTALYGFYARVGLQGEVVNILNHALYKSSLFLLIGWVEKVMGTRDLRILERENWFRTEKVGAVLIGIGAFAMAGVPFLLGFMSKEVFYEAILGENHEGLGLALLIAVAASILAMGYALKLFVGTFFGRETPPQGRGYPRYKVSPWLLIVPAVLLTPQVIAGVVPAWYLGGVVEPGTEWPSGLALWHHIDILLAVSLTTFTLGIGTYLVWRRIAAIPDFPGAQRFFDRLRVGTLAHSAWLSRAVQAGGHPRFIALTLIAAIAAMVGGIAWGGAALPRARWEWGPDIGIAWLPAAAIIGAAVLTLLIPRRIAKVVMMAIVGYGMAVFYVLFRAPDLALTQLLVETVSLILLLLIFRRMPELLKDARPTGQRVLHGAVAVVTGVAMAALTWSAGTHMARDRAGHDQLALSYPVAQGENVVNVILVDFRGVDTFGEIMVLAIAALGALALLRAGRRGALREAPRVEREEETAATSDRLLVTSERGGPGEVRQ
ncbi:MAG TPA: hydrogen gas-evolving membrane-bound hydrogenase subunit E [Longimicrobiaceae bacterium]|nr:hydrogen gas-evolving membrane-bound hydrogenase subunit E [Longimicrobiaceae bacterium]